MKITPAPPTPRPRSARRSFRGWLLLAACLAAGLGFVLISQPGLSAGSAPRPAAFVKPAPSPTPFQPAANPAPPSSLPIAAPQARDGASLYLPVIQQRRPPSNNLADDWFLMVDDGHILTRTVERRYFSFTKSPFNPIMVADRYWEGAAIQLFGTVLPEYRMWYCAYNAFSNNPNGKSSVLYATSSDGIHWTKPDLNGSGNNILFLGSGVPSMVTPPDDAQQPYRMMVYQSNSFRGYWSTDGTHLAGYAGNPLLAPAPDVGHFYYDPRTGGYGGTLKESVVLNGVARRASRMLASSNFTTWTRLPVVLSPDQTDDAQTLPLYTHFYGLPVFADGEQYLGLLWILKAPDVAGLLGKTTVQLVSSHDGLSWIREEGSRPALLDVGKAGAWDGGQIYTASQPLRVGNQYWLYYSGCDKPHGSSLPDTHCAIGLATAPYNRLAALSGTGQALTDLRPAATGEAYLHVNYKATDGNVCAELLGEDGAPLPGYTAADCMPLSGDSQDLVLRWNNLARLPDVPYHIRFILTGAALYAYAIR